VFGERKFGGNAQAITNKRWLHHTSFLWDFDPANMAALTNPAKQPDYRQVRSMPDPAADGAAAAPHGHDSCHGHSCSRHHDGGLHLYRDPWPIAHRHSSTSCAWHLVIVSSCIGHVLLLPLLQGREHGSFLVRLKEVLPSRQQFIQELQDNADQHFELRVSQQR
jgi:hypothetical protein